MGGVLYTQILKFCQNEGFSSQATHTKKAGYFPRKPVVGSNINKAIGTYEEEKYRFIPWFICALEMIVEKSQVKTFNRQSSLGND